MRHRWLILVAGTVLGGCTSGSGDPVPPIPCDPEVQECQYETVQGIEYPDGPFGTSVGDVIEPFSFNGYVNPSAGIGESARALIELSDFYNPTGEDVYPEGSPFGEGNPKPTVVMVNVAAVWCQPCKEEAAVILPMEYAKYGPSGMELVSILTDSAEPGEAADFNDLDNWTSAFSSEYPSVIDPSYSVGSLIDTTQYPANFIVDTSDMTIAEVAIGKPTQGFFNTIENLLE